MDDRAVEVAPLQQCERERVAEFTLDDTFQRTSAKGRVVAAFGQQVLRRTRHVQGQSAILETTCERAQLDVDDCPEIIAPEWSKANDLVDAIDELGLEVVDRLTLQVRGHDQDRVREVD